MSVTVKQQAGPRVLSSLNPQARLTFRLSVAFAVWCLIQQAASFRSLVPPVGLIQAVIFGIIAVRVARGSRRALLAAPIAAAVLLLISTPYIVQDLGHPGDVVDFVWTLVAIPLVLSAAAAGIAGWRASRERPGLGR
jgi:hypothetical protein